MTACWTILLPLIFALLVIILSICVALDYLSIL
jgi:hypothetical protein